MFWEVKLLSETGRPEGGRSLRLGWLALSLSLEVMWDLHAPRACSWECSVFHQYLQRGMMLGHCPPSPTAVLHVVQLLNRLHNTGASHSPVLLVGPLPDPRSPRFQG